MSGPNKKSILCLASEFKGVPFIEEVFKQGARVLLVVKEENTHHPWPHDKLDGFFKMPDLYTQPNIIYAVSYLARTNKIDSIVALDDYDVATAATLREHLRLPGLNESTARHFRDKLAMRVKAQQSGIRVPRFTAVFNYDELRQYMDQVAPPWVLKPRFEAGAVGIRKLHEPEQVWRALEELGDQQSFYLLEQFLPGDVYHIDSIIWEGNVIFTLVSKYGAPPLSLTQGGGIFNTRTLDRQSEEAKTLNEKNQEIMQHLGHARGVAHTEFIRAQSDNQFYFLETAARVGGANIDRMVKAASGIELWAEAARIELAGIEGQTYHLPQYKQDYAGLITCLARQENPDLRSFDEPEVIWQLQKPYHAGLLISSPSAERVQELLDKFNDRFAQDFLQHIPQKKQARTAL